MVVVDSCGWIEWLEESPLAASFEPVLRDLEQLMVPTAVQMELYKWISQHLDGERAAAMIQYSAGGNVAPLTQDIAVHAAKVAVDHRLSFADAVIYATALQYNATLLTSDAHFKDLPHVRYIKKTKL